MRSVVLPQAIRNILPATGNEFVVNIKDTSVLNVISVSASCSFQSQDPHRRALIYRYFEAFFVTCACIYLVYDLSRSRGCCACWSAGWTGKDTYTIHGSQTVPEGEIKVVKKND